MTEEEMQEMIEDLDKEESQQLLGLLLDTMTQDDAVEVLKERALLVERLQVGDASNGE